MTTRRASSHASPAPAPSAGAAKPPSDPDFMLSLARGLAVIRAFGEGKPQLSIREVALATGFSRAAARRCLHTLTTLGYATGAGGVYELTPATLSLASNYLGSTSIARVAQPILERVSNQLHESSSVAVLDGDDIVYVARAAVRRILSIGLAVGSRLPAPSTSMGRVLIANLDEASRVRVMTRVKLSRHTPRTIVDKTEFRAELDRIRAQGYAIVDQELELGLRSMAVPIVGPGRRVQAAINVGVHAGRADRQTLLREFLPVLQQAAADIGAATRGA
jgi:IclR family transcriptional regulator, pca regulon regulatory protein